MNAEIGQGHEPGVGALLRASRVRCGEDLRDVATLLRIRYPFLEAIEEGRYGDLPGVTYAIGFVRTYAEHLGLDSDEVVRRFKAETENLERKTDLDFPIPIAERSTPGGAIVFVGILLAVIAYGAWYVGTSKNSFLVDLVSPLPHRLAALVHGNGEPAGTPPAVASGADTVQPTVAEAETTGGGPVQPSATGTEAKSTPAAPSTTVEATTPPQSGVPQGKSAVTADGHPEAAVIGHQASPASSPAPPPPATVATTAPAKAASNLKPVSVSAIPVKAPVASVTPPPVSVVPPHPALPAVHSEPTKPAPVTPSKMAAASVEKPRMPMPPAAPAAAPASVAEASAAGPVAEAGAGGPAVPVKAKPSSAVGEPAAPKSRPPAATSSATPGERPTTAQVAAIPAVPEVAAPAATQKQPEATAAKASRIVVRAKLDSWIQVRDSIARRLLVTRLLRAGDSYRVPNRPGLTLLTGNAGALEILVDGKPVPSIGGIGTVRRDVALDADKLKAGTAVVD